MELSTMNNIGKHNEVFTSRIMSSYKKRPLYKKGNIQNNNRFSYLNPQTAIILTNDGLSSVVGTTGRIDKAPNKLTRTHK